jgi:geranylgeranyl transferase type-1 subunit beta
MFIRENQGFQGRTNKEADTCYSFWISGTLSMLYNNHNHNNVDVNYTEQRQAYHYLLEDCQHAKYGGFSKQPDCYPDVMHSFYALCYFAVMKEIPQSFHVSLGICQEKWEKYLQMKNSHR